MTDWAACSCQTAYLAKNLLLLTVLIELKVMGGPHWFYFPSALMDCLLFWLNLRSWGDLIGFIFTAWLNLRSWGDLIVATSRPKEVAPSTLQHCWELRRIFHILNTLLTKRKGIILKIKQMLIIFMVFICKIYII